MTPTTCKALMDAGYHVTVERSTQRIFDGMSQIIVLIRCNKTSQLIAFHRRGIRQGMLHSVHSKSPIPIAIDWSSSRCGGLLGPGRTQGCRHFGLEGAPRRRFPSGACSRHFRPLLQAAGRLGEGSESLVSRKGYIARPRVFD